MANLTRIKILTTGATTSAPSNIKTGELAYSYVSGTQANNGDRLYIGTGTETGGIASNVDIIGGKYFTQLLDHTHGTATANSALIVDSNLNIDQLNIGALALETSGGTGQVVNSISTSTTLAGATDTQLITALAAKTYIDAQVTAQDLDFIADSGGALSIDLDTETFGILGGTGLSTVGSGNSVTINIDDTGVGATQTVGSATQIPVLTINPQGQITVATFASVATALDITDGSNTTTIDLLTEDLTVSGTTDETTVVVSNNTITFGLPDNVVITTDLRVGQDLDVDRNANVDGTLDVTGDVKVNTNKFTVDALTGNTLVAGTLNVTDDVTVGASKVTIDAQTGDTVVEGTLDVTGVLTTDTHVIVGGNLTVQGTTTTVESTVITLDDPVLMLADNTTVVTSDGVDRGINFKWGNGVAVVDGFFGFDIQTERFVFKPDDSGETNSTDENFDAPWGDVQFGNAYLTGADIGNIGIGITTDNTIDTTSGDLVIDAASNQVNVTANLDVAGTLSATTLTLTNDLAVVHGGTGVSALTGNSVLIANGAGTAFSFITGTLGDVIQFDASGIPVASNIIDGGTY